MIWAAGVVASRLAAVLAERAALRLDSAGRVEALEGLTVPGHPDVLVIGDMVRIRQANGSSIVFPGLAPVAMQQGHTLPASYATASSAARRDPSATATNATWPASDARAPSPRSNTSG